MIDGEEITGYNVVNKEEEVDKMWDNIYRVFTPEQWRNLLIICGIVLVAGIVLEIIQRCKR